MRWVILHHSTSSLLPEKSAGACKDISQTERVFEKSENVIDESAEQSPT